MRIQILSDLHLEFRDFVFEDAGADIVVLAGDTHKGVRGIRWAAEQIKDRPVLYVLGNHEYYSEAWPRLIDKARDATLGTNVHLLEDQVFELDGVSFLGCTLWTDFAALDDRSHAKLTASLSMRDYRKIRVSPKYGRLRPSHTASIHLNSLGWLKQQFATDAKKVVITHHAPSKRSLPENEHTAIGAAYASDLETVIGDSNAAYWFHGHIHFASRYQVGNTTVIANPRGYPGEDTGFDPRLTVTV